LVSANHGGTLNILGRLTRQEDYEELVQIGRDLEVNSDITFDEITKPTASSFFYSTFNPFRRRMLGDCSIYRAKLTHNARL